MKAAKVLIQGGWKKLKLQMEFKRVNDRFSKEILKFNSDEIN